MDSRKIQILAVDENKDSLIALQALILQAFPQATVFTAHSGQHALDLASVEFPDVILLGTIVQGMDRLELCTRLKGDQELQDIPLVFITSTQDDREARIKALESGAEAFLSQPIDLIELTVLLRSMFKIRAAAMQRHDEKEVLASFVQEKTQALRDSNAKTQQLLDAVKRDQALIDAIFDSIPGYLYVYDETGRLIKWNKQHETMTGYSASELSMMTLDDWFGQ